MTDALPTMLELGLRHRTDKAMHAFCGTSYLDVYDWYFRSIRDAELSILEIGVLTGASLRVWRDYFKNARIVGIDINPLCKRINGMKSMEGRVCTMCGDQSDRKFLDKVADAHGPFDIVIDDGSHVIRHMIASFNHLIARTNLGAYYCFEDLSNTFVDLEKMRDGAHSWPGMGFNTPASLTNVRSDWDAFITELAQVIDAYGHAPERLGLDPTISPFQFMHHWPHQTTIRREGGSRVWSENEA